MARKFIKHIKQESYVDFVKEAKEVLDAEHEKQIREYTELLLRTGNLVNENRAGEGEELTEAALTRKHFKLAADAVKSIEDRDKRKEMAHHHAQIFAKANPRFDRARFMQAAGVDEAPVDSLSADEKFGVRRYNPKLMN
jgi:hypothetical protein